MKKKNVKNGKKDIIIIVLAIIVLISGIWNILNILREDKELRTSFYSASYLSLLDGDFDKEYNFTYNSSYIKVEFEKEKKEIKVTPIKPGDLTLKIDYTTNFGEKKTKTYDISIRKGLSIEIENK